MTKLQKILVTIGMIVALIVINLAITSLFYQFRVHASLQQVHDNVVPISVLIGGLFGVELIARLGIGYLAGFQLFRIWNKKV